MGELNEAVEAVKGFSWWNYGLDEVSETQSDDWAHALVAEVAPLIVAATRRQVAEEIAEAITHNVRNPDFSKQDRGGFVGFTECMAYVAGHDKAAAIARGRGETGGGHAANGPESHGEPRSRPTDPSGHN